MFSQYCQFSLMRISCGIVSKKSVGISYVVSWYTPTMTAKELMQYIEFLNKFSAINRTVKTKGKRGFETDAEHSYQLALVAWYVSEKTNLKLNRQRLLEYSLVHDLVEVYAGDTDPYSHSTDFINSKAKREHLALKQIKHEFPDFQSLTTIIEKYEKLEDQESKLVYLLDKILPVLNTYISDHSYYKDNNVSFETWKKWLDAKIVKSKLSDPAALDLLKKITLVLNDKSKFIFSE
jgi:putative hydrolase of HD superfamily